MVHVKLKLCVETVLCQQLHVETTDWNFMKILPYTVGLDKDPRRHWYGSPLDVDQNVQIFKALVSVLIIKN